MTARRSLALFLICLALYAASSIGGIRSPDSEVVFRSCEALAQRGTMAHDTELPWRGFGVADGRDGRRWSIFGPLQPLACVPVYMLVEALLPSGPDAGADLPYGMSFHVGSGLTDYLASVPPDVPREHALRFFVSFMNALFGALGVLVFAALARRVSGSDTAALATAVVYAVGSLAWPYAATFFSEPLTTLLALTSLWLLVREQAVREFGLAGLTLGLAAASHVTGVLFAPFFAAYALLISRRSRRLAPALWFGAGLGLVLVALAAWNAWRFGSPFETGRAVDAETAAQLGYGRWVAPWEGLYGLISSSGKGLLLYCPAALLGALAWPALRRRNAALAWTVLAAVLARVLFIACRSDWHGGFSLGPRLLVPIVPLLILPIAAWLAETAARLRLVAAAAVLLAAQQLYFVVGEVFAYSYIARQFEWATSPLLHLFEAPKGPFWLQRSETAPELIWGAGAVLLTGALLLVFRRLEKA